MQGYSVTLSDMHTWALLEVVLCYFYAPLKWEYLWKNSVKSPLFFKMSMNRSITILLYREAVPCSSLSLYIFVVRVDKCGHTHTRESAPVLQPEHQLMSFSISFSAFVRS